MLNSGHSSNLHQVKARFQCFPRFQRYFVDNIVFQLVCSVFKTEISSFQPKNENVFFFFTRIVFLSTLAKKFCKSRTFLPYFGVFRQILSSCEKHVVSASSQHFGSYHDIKMDKSARLNFFFRFLRVFFCPNFYYEHCVLAGFQYFFADSIAFLLKTLRLSLFASFLVVK